MRRLILAAVAATLALAGGAVGQDRAGVAFYGNSSQDPITNTNGGPSYGFGLGSNSSADWKRDPKRVAVVTGALRQYQLACEPDRVALCSTKKGSPADQCLVYHRLKLSSPCKQAMTTLSLAQRGAL